MYFNVDILYLNSRLNYIEFYLTLKSREKEKDLSKKFCQEKNQFHIV